MPVDEIRRTLADERIAASAALWELIPDEFRRDAKNYIVQADGCVSISLAGLSVNQIQTFIAILRRAM
jgi:hypothetical protein